MSAPTTDDRWLGVKKIMGDKRITFGRHLSHWFYRSPRRFLHCMSYYKFASKLIGPRKRVLDVACGEGLGSWLLAVENGYCHGVDLDSEAIAQAQQNYNDPRIAFRCEDFLEMAPTTWNAVVNFDVIEHILPANVGRFWDKIVGCLDHDGVAVIGTPSLTSDQFANPISRAGHVNLYSGERLAEEMGQYFHHVFMFAGNDEVVHTGFLPLAHYLIGVGCRKKG